MKMTKIVPWERELCCGCGLCSNICPVNAIEMCADNEGFLYPVVNKKLCVKCGLCGSKCEFVNIEPGLSHEPFPPAYVIKHKNTEVRMNSRSGGVFTACSELVLDSGGVVYGCILNSSMEAVHIRTENKNMRNKMCKSKYVQSRLEGNFEKVGEDLKNGRTVLFTGTGCQVDAMLAFLKAKNINTEKLFTIDLVCHGCASPLIFKEYIHFLEKKYHGKVEHFDFRDKEIHGWDDHIESAVINGKKYKGIIYREIFHTDFCIRPSCYQCKYAVAKRNSDLTIADAWGIKEAMPDFNDNRGVSLVIVQDRKGLKLLEAIKDLCDTEEIPLTRMMQGNLMHPTECKDGRSEFWKNYYEGGFNSLVRKYVKISFPSKIKAWVRYQIRKIILGKKYYLP